MIFRWSGKQISEVSQVFFLLKMTFFEIWALLKSFKNDFPMVRAQKKLRSFSSFFLKNDPPENHEKTTFRAFLETKGPRDPPWMQERQILFRIALTRALYDQTAPQLCLFYVPRLVKNPGWSKIRAGQKSGLVIEKSRSRTRTRVFLGYRWVSSVLIFSF